MRKIRKILILGFFFLNIFFLSYTQKRLPQEYLILTFERVRYVNGERIDSKEYYWITLIDSIKKNNYDFYPLYLRDYSNDVFENCCLGDTIDIFSMTNMTNFNFEEEYIVKTNELKKFLHDHRKTIQTIRKKWTHKRKENISVYATALKGDFCNCILNSKNYTYKGQVFIPRLKYNYEELKSYIKFYEKRYIKDFANFTISNSPDY